MGLRRGLAIAAALLPMLGAAEPAAAEGEAGGDGTLTIGMTQFPSSFHPLIDSMLAKSYVLGMTRRPVTAYDPDWELVCMLCVKLPTLDNGLAEREPLPDGGEGIAVTYEIEPGATWGDGTPVTTEDVVFTWQVGRHPKSGVASSEPFRRIREVEVHGPKRFTLHVDRVQFDYNDLPLGLLPAHLERKVFEAAPAEYRNRTTFDADPTNPGLYFGPYRIVDVEPGATVTLEPNPTWYGPPPAFDRIVVRVIENTAALEANLMSGAIDMIAGPLGLKVDQALALQRRHAARFRFVFEPSLTYEHIDLNLDNPILADKRVRKGLIHAIDRRAISERLFQGENPVAHGPVSPQDRAHTADVPTYAYDPAKADELLDAAGWSGMRDGVRVNGDGERLSLTLMTTAGDRTRELVQQVLQSQWAEAGVDIRIRNEPARVYFGETVAKRTFTGMAMFAWLSAPESVPRSTLHSEEIPTPETNWSGQNYTGFSNPRMDDLIDRIEVELDWKRRKALWGELQRLYAEELPVIPLYWRAHPHVIPKWLEGLEPTGHQFPPTLWVEDWHRVGG